MNVAFLFNSDDPKYSGIYDDRPGASSPARATAAAVVASKARPLGRIEQEAHAVKLLLAHVIAVIAGIALYAAVTALTLAASGARF